MTRKKSRPSPPLESAPPASAPPSDTLPPAEIRDPSPTEMGGMPAAGVWEGDEIVDLTIAEEPTAGDEEPPPGEDPQIEAADSGAPTDRPPEIEPARELSQAHLAGLVEALVFASDKPMKAIEVARLASAPVKQVRAVLADLKEVYASRGVVLDEVAGGWLFRTAVQYAPFVRELASEKPVRLTRAQVETLAIAAYRQPITRPEIDDIRGVDSGATLKLLLERDLVRILGKKDEPGRPILYGTTTGFLELFGLKSLKDLPTLKEFTELTEDSRRVAEAELGEVLPGAAEQRAAEEQARETGDVAPEEPAGEPGEEHDTVAPPAPPTDSELEDPP